MDLAVGMVIGTAFTSIVNSLVNDIIMPVVGLLIGGIDFTNLKLVVPNFFGLSQEAVIDFGSFLQNVVSFLVIAFSLFMVVRTMNRLKARSIAAAKKAEEKLAATKKSPAKKAKK